MQDEVYHNDRNARQLRRNNAYVGRTRGFDEMNDQGPSAFQMCIPTLTGTASLPTNERTLITFSAYCRPAQRTARGMDPRRAPPNVGTLLSRWGIVPFYVEVEASDFALATGCELQLSQ